MDAISRGVVRTLESPRDLLEQVVGAAAAYLDTEWTLLALADGCLLDARPRFLALGRDAACVEDERELPDQVRRELGAIRAGLATHDPDERRWIRVPMMLDGQAIGGLAGLRGPAGDPEPGDLAVLRILANQAAVSLHTCEEYQAGLAMRRRAHELHDQATAQARDLEARTSELRAAERRLVLAHQRELIDAERHRIARELHDSVMQYVLSAGMAVEVARGDAEALADDSGRIQERLRVARELTQEAVDQLRRAIYALHRTHSDTVSPLPDLLHEVAEHHRPQLDVEVRVTGTVTPLPADADHEIARAVGEALFNVALHARATRAVVRLSYTPQRLLVSVSDDGHGDAADLGRRLRLERGESACDHHRGLANIESRITELGGTLAFRRARIGGLRVELRVPLPLPDGRFGTIGTLPGEREEMGE